MAERDAHPRAGENKYKEDAQAMALKQYQAGLFDKGIQENQDIAGGFQKTQEAQDTQDIDQAIKIGGLQKEGLIPTGKVAAKAGFLGGIKPKSEKEQLEIQKLKQDLSGPQSQFKGLPEENKKQIDTLSTKTATKKAINNQIKSALASLEDENVSEEQKIIQGRSLLKVLNSTEGADAIGAEESKRLGSLLEYQMGNFTQPGPVFGRDVKGFIDQVKNSSKALDKSIEMNEQDVDKLYGRSPKNPPPLDTKVINGKSYRKVKGGWEEVS